MTAFSPLWLTERSRRSGRPRSVPTRRVVALYDYDPRESSPNVDVEVGPAHAQGWDPCPGQGQPQACVPTRAAAGRAPSHRGQTSMATRATAGRAPSQMSQRGDDSAREAMVALGDTHSSP